MKVLTCSVCFLSDDKSIVLSCCHSICRACALEEVQKKKSVWKCGNGNPFVCPKCNGSMRTQSGSDLTLEVVQDIFEASIDSKHELPAEENVYHVAEKGAVKKKEIRSNPKHDLSSSNEIKATKTTKQSVPEEQGERDVHITASNNIVEVLNNSKAFPNLVLETRKSQQMKFLQSKAAAVMKLFANQKKLLLDRLSKMEEGLLKTLEDTVARRCQEFDIYERSINVLNKRLEDVETSQMHHGKNITETMDLQTNLQLLVVEYTQLSNLINSHTVEPVDLQLVSEGEMKFRLTGLCQDQIIESKQKNCNCEKLQTEGLSCNYSLEVRTGSTTVSYTHLDVYKRQL
ncbi:uncharacterized protein LOC117123999 [Anneissia japonica]|uniref:uncharacterized protein LOC117123999 n=1 Tax=Anneissia japonica TaxID=1529436 RepID=UPI0014259A39|nr:uncharacterized protein LOC117123999 [Anneissia japonica]